MVIRLIKQGWKWIFMMIAVVLLLASCAGGKILLNEEVRTTKNPYDTTLYDITFLEGVRQKLSGNYGEAVDKLEEAIEINPESDAAFFQISQISAMRRDFANALKYGRRAAQIDRENTWYLLNMANLFMQNSRIDSAIYWLEEVVEVDPQNEEVKFQLANMYMNTGSPEKAEELLLQFYDKYKGNEQIQMALLQAKISAGKYDEALNIIDEEARKDTLRAELKGVLAEIYSKKGDNEKAEEFYRSARDDDETNWNTEYSYLQFLLDNRKYDLLFTELNEMFKEGENMDNKIGLLAFIVQNDDIVSEYSDELIEVGLELMTLDSINPTITLLMSEIYGKAGMHEKEIKVLTDFVEADERQYYVWEDLLMKLNDEGNTDMLYDYAGRAAKLFNTAPLPKLLYAYALIEKEEYAKASAELNKVRILVNNEDRFLVQILAMEAEIAYRKNDFDAAIEKFEEALRIEPENLLVMNNYAYYLAEKDRELDRALNMIKKCLEKENNITYLDTYAWILYKMKRYKDAEAVMVNIFESVRVTDAELLEHYGFIKKAGNDCKRAVSLWQMALKEDKTKTYLVEEIRKCIEE